ncbi:protein S100-A8-like [Anolis carolinensis]|uniref:protein S100-A8-like n=1 Tax=Anolis carolinensis TaxID=28377 RepID=UPI002F2B5B9D
MSHAHATPAGHKPKLGDAEGNCTLEKAFTTIINAYHRYSPRQGKDDFLSPQDLKEMLQEQLPTFLEACGRNRPGYIEQLFKESDINKDKVLTFEETVRIFLKVADDAHRLSHKEDRCGPDKD